MSNQLLGLVIRIHLCCRLMFLVCVWDVVESVVDSKVFRGGDIIRWPLSF